MKCPKCGYLGFEHVERCRNCGYDFSLTESSDTPELPIRSAESFHEGALDEDLALGEPPIPRTPSRQSAFRRDLEDAPLITRPSPPRQPLSVRRATPEVQRARPTTSRIPMLDLADAALSSAALPQEEEWSPAPGGELEAAPVSARITAATIDLLILAAIDVVVVYFTMQICGLTFEDVSILPRGPLLAFLLVQNGGYLVAFTAGGQTLGKMAAGIKVVAATEDTPLDLGHSLLRTLVWAMLAVPAGLGFLSALFNDDHRGLHDRFAGTRVVRAF
jgi:uncharacterized RDD family membrane protein YckC